MSSARVPASLGPLGRLGRWAATHGRIVAGVWILLVLGLGGLAPRVERALSGAGWEATGSESVQAREQIDASFDGGGSYALQVVVSSDSAKFGDPAFTASIERAVAVLDADDRVARVTPPRDGVRGLCGRTYGDRDGRCRGASRRNGPRG